MSEWGVSVNVSWDNRLTWMHVIINTVTDLLKPIDTTLCDGFLNIVWLNAECHNMMITHSLSCTHTIRCCCRIHIYIIFLASNLNVRLEFWLSTLDPSSSIYTITILSRCTTMERIHDDFSSTHNDNIFILAITIEVCWNQNKTEITNSNSHIEVA